MKVLKSWLKEYVSSEVSDERLAEILTLAGFDVEEMLSGIDSRVIVAKIIKIEIHPNADRLKIVVANFGQEDIRVICGASNIKEGQLVPLALPGAKLSTGEIKVSKIRGIESFGMLCTQDELGIGDDQDGIFLLPPDYEIGRPLCEYFGSDTIIDLDITANRGDCLSHLGIAREVAVFENVGVRKEPITLSKTDSTKSSSKISLEVKNPDLCPQYLARTISGVKIGPSPKWIQDRLIACGAKPINNIVDVTNYILLDLGHPMHAFDWKKIKNSKIIVRNAKQNEKIVSLDSEIRNLSSEMLVIADGEKPIAIAGIIGGQNSEVDEKTETIVLEAAEFDCKSVRSTAKNLNLSTEASYRFERGIDSDGIEYAINKAADLIVKTAGGKILQGIIQSGEKPDHTEIGIEYNKICQLLGHNIKGEEINHILRHLGFMVKDNIVIVPSWRHDISIWQDLAEEIGRVFGYDKIKPIALPKIKPAIKTAYYLVENLKDLLVSCGYTETMNYPFLSADDVKIARLNPSDLLEVANPMQPENKYLRPSLISGLLKNIAKNPSFDPIQIFEIGHTFSRTREALFLSLATAGKSISSHEKALSEILSKLGGNVKVVTQEFSAVELQKYKIKKANVIISEINLSKIFADTKIDQNIDLNVSREQIAYRSISKYPAITRDLAFVVDKAVVASDVSAVIYSVSELVNRVELFDEFFSDKLGTGKKNLAYHIYLQSKDKTLNDKEAKQLIDLIVKSVEKKFSAKLRKA